MRRHAPRAFSLVELLVVLAIISLLFALLMPSLSRARESAKTVVCAHHMKQLLSILVMYSQENRGKVPQTYDAQTNAWAFPLIWTGYLRTNAVISTRNPTDRTLYCLASKVLWDGYYDWLRGHYGLNLSITGTGYPTDAVTGQPVNKSTPLSRVMNPSNKILLIDSGTYSVAYGYVTAPKYAIWYVPGLSNNVNVTPTSWPIYNEKDALLGRHFGKRVNIGWVDGHVTTVPVETVKDIYLWLAQ